MSDNPLDNMPTYNRVSVRAVLVKEGDDPGAALAKTGFAEVVTVPVVVGDQADLPGGILGDGVTANVTAVLETEEEDDHDALPRARGGLARSISDEDAPSGPVTATLPAAYGIQPLAPVRKNGG